MVSGNKYFILVDGIPMGERYSTISKAMHAALDKRWCAERHVEICEVKERIDAD